MPLNDTNNYISNVGTNNIRNSYYNNKGLRNNSV
jgi:hypothetical protein